MPAGEITVMAVTVVCVVATHKLAVGVVTGSVTAMVFAKRVARLADPRRRAGSGACRAGASPARSSRR
ncbi:hypothetical protein AB0F18_11505 [Streptomyces sp. NPDC029216]|uniref:hypothetical protein n=1 Tax=Streptomyces sp. NPDC029216 TaxID=3154701 RepID=UPI0033F66B81